MSITQERRATVAQNHAGLEVRVREYRRLTDPTMRAVASTHLSPLLRVHIHALEQLHPDAPGLAAQFADREEEMVPRYWRHIEALRTFLGKRGITV